MSETRSEPYDTINRLVVELAAANADRARLAVRVESLEGRLMMIAVHTDQEHIRQLVTEVLDATARSTETTEWKMGETRDVVFKVTKRTRPELVIEDDEPPTDDAAILAAVRDNLDLQQG